MKLLLLLFSFSLVAQLNNYHFNLSNYRDGIHIAGGGI